jgi:hypothetical protein
MMATNLTTGLEINGEDQRRPAGFPCLAAFPWLDSVVLQKGKAPFEFDRRAAKPMLSGRWYQRASRRGRV